MSSHARESGRGRPGDFFFKADVGMKKLVLATTLALLVTPATAAATQWFYDWKPVPAGEVVELPLHSEKLLVTFKLPRSTTFEHFLCAASGADAFWNEGAEGRSEVRSLTFACPEGTTIETLLPWGSALVDGALPLHDRFEGVWADLTYEGVDYGDFAGALEPVYGDVDPTEEQATRAHDEPDSYVTFRNFSPYSPLRGRQGALLWLTGICHVGSREAFITDESGVF